jgi:hypothetical protein
MNDDPLAEFRRAGAAPVPLATRRLAEKGEQRPYEAFSARDGQRQARINIRRKGGVSQAPSYNFIIDIAYDDERYESILLLLTEMTVFIRGRNLRPIADALIQGTCRFVQEFREDLFDRPKDEAAPFIEAIDALGERRTNQAPARAA